MHEFEKKMGKAVRRYSDYEGYTNWDTWSVALEMDNDPVLYEKSRTLRTPQELRDWALQAVIAPHNSTALADAQGYNEVPQEERIDPHYEEFKEKHQDSKGWDAINSLIGGPNTEDYNPSNHMIDQALVNWDELFQHHEAQRAENESYEQGNNGFVPKPDPATLDQPGQDTFPEEWNAPPV